MGSSRGKTAFALECSIREMCRRDSRAISGSLTFRENVTDKEYASKCLRRLLARISRRYPKYRMCGVWELQDRGAWHVHYVGSAFIDVVWLRSAAVECGFGPQMKLQPVEPVDGFRHRGVDRAVDYCCKYLKEDLAGGCYGKGARLVFYHGPMSRAASTRFSWRGGFHRLYRLGRALFSDVYGVVSQHELHSRVGLIIRMGWEQLTGDEQWEMLTRSPAIRRWWYGSEFSEDFPF